MDIRFEGNLDDHFGTVVHDLHRLGVLDSGEPIRLDLERTRYLGPFAVAVFAAVIEHKKSGGVESTVLLPGSPPALAAYCGFSGFAALAGVGDRPDPDHPNNQTVPIRVFKDSAPWELGHSVSRLVRRHADITDDTDEYLATCVNEVANNVVDHSSSRFGGVLTARWIQSRREVRVAIMDCGEGIFETLSKKHAEISDPSDAMRRVIQGGISAKSRENNMGLGIWNLCSAVRQLRGELSILSKTVFARIRPGHEDRIGLLDHRFPGTGVFMSLPTDTAEE